jgi:5-methylthioadenosine/S-adenosylhomocysteine deaminase
MAPWRCSDEAMRRITEQASDWGVPTHIHVAETEAEIDLMRQRAGLGHVEWLNSLGVLGADTQLVHCVHVSDAEIDLIAASGATVIHCPTSNMTLGSGVAPVAQMTRRGIPIALGTDGSASHNCQDLLETAKHAVLLSRVSSRDPLALTAAEALRMMTTGGVRVFGRTDLGRIAPGCKADLTLINLNNSRCVPVYRADAAVVYSACGADVDTVLVDGRILLDHGVVTMVDEASLLAECRAVAAQLWRVLG